MFDTHCHLTDERLRSQLGEVLDRAKAAGVTRMVTIGTDPDDWPACLDLCRQYPAMLRCAVGVHPNNCHEVDPAEVPRLRDLQGDSCVVALGEMGLDYHHKFAPRDLQAKFLEMQLQIAADFDRPVVIHCREAVDDCLAIIKSFPKVRGVFHCFTGTVPESARILDAGYYLGFTGVATFKNAEELRSAARQAPADRILVETDAPYLAPEPERKRKVNEPALVVHTAAAIAAARGISLEQIDQITTENAKRFYRWD